MNRPVIPPNPAALDSMAAETMVEVVKKVGHSVDGKIVRIDEIIGVDDEVQYLLILDVVGQKRHAQINLNDIDRIYIGTENNSAIIVGGLLGVIADIAILGWMITELAKSLGD